MKEFEEIRPYHDDEVESVIATLLADKDLLDFVAKYHSPFLTRVFPALLRFGAGFALKRTLGDVKTVRDFQAVISFYAKKLVAETSAGFNFEGIKALKEDQAYLYVGNHRDIAGDSMFIDYALWLSERETVRIAVGDNLIQREFATSLMRLNKSFFIRRSETGAKKIYAALLESSRFIHQSIQDGHSVWIAQSEGRAKDGIDITDPAIVKMFALAKRKQNLAETVAALNIVPVSISYEFDPCDKLKAKELTLIEENGHYEKASGEDLLSLVLGLGEFKGRIYLNFGKKIEGDFQNAEEVANAIDRQVLANYQLFYVNYWALKILAGRENTEKKYSDAWQNLKDSIDNSKMDEFENKFEQRLEDCPSAWQQKWLEMYANPVVHKYQAHSGNLAPV